MPSVVEEIAAKSASLPSELQHEVLDFVDFVSEKGRRAKTMGKAFQSVRGMLARDLPNLENDLAEVRKEMWGNFADEDSE